MKLVFSSTGDELPLSIGEVAEWYVQQLDQDGVNQFHQYDRPISKSMSKLKKVLENTNNFFTKKFNINVFDQYTGKRLTQNDLNHISYIRGNESPLDLINNIEAFDFIFLVNPPNLDLIFDVAESGETMPQKSTYFFPKVYSGLIFASIGDK